MADGDSLKITIVGSVLLRVIANGKDRMITLTDIYLAPQLARNIVSYGKLEHIGFGLVYRGSGRYLVRRIEWEIAFDVSMHTNVLYVKTSVTQKNLRAALMAVIFDAGSSIPADYVQIGSRMHFHARKGHLSLTTIERMAKTPISGI
uniref:Retrovirus-related Pol polyprotein from transposon TNT 1-94-like beta-barrel domain-containing protein n=1 Tax=Peronospora matthiolae TaxID=2874970 RepID=A0AAV1VAX2_9STRA